MDCPDFSEFQDKLNAMRTLDDKLIYALNASVPTDSFRGRVDATETCRELFAKIQSGHGQREVAIKKCIMKSADEVRRLKEAADADPAVRRQFTAERTRLRLLQSELSVEEVIKERTLKVFNERCRNYYKPEKT